MKTILAILVAFFCFTAIQCTFVPNNTECIHQSGWRHQNVTIDQTPVPGKNATFTFCGRNVLGIDMKMTEVDLYYGPDRTRVVFPVSHHLKSGQDLCFDLNLRIPEGFSPLGLQFQPNAWLVGECGCIFVTLFGSQNFLGERF